MKGLQRDQLVRSFMTHKIKFSTEMQHTDHTCFKHSGRTNKSVIDLFKGGGSSDSNWLRVSLGCQTDPQLCALLELKHDWACLEDVHCFPRNPFILGMKRIFGDKSSKGQEQSDVWSWSSSKDSGTPQPTLRTAWFMLLKPSASLPNFLQFPGIHVSSYEFITADC